MTRSPALTVCVALLLASSAGATTYTVGATMDGLQEVPPVVTPGTGTLTGSYDDSTNILLWSGSFSDLTGTTTDAHFHGPGGLVQVHMTAAGGGDTFPLGVTSGSFSGTATLSAAQETQLLANSWYVNIHTNLFFGGEIRGTVLTAPVPEPSTLALLALGLLGLARAGRVLRA